MATTSSNNEHYTAKDTAGTKEETRPAKDQSQNGQLGSKIKYGEIINSPRRRTYAYLVSRAAMHVVHGTADLLS